MTPTDADQIAEVLRKVVAKCIRLEARCDALGAVLVAVGQQAGMDSARVNELIEKATAIAHQKALERIEAGSPAAAAAADDRPPGTDLGI